MMPDQFEQDLRDSLEGYKIRPSDNIWKRIERDLLHAGKGISVSWKKWMMLIICSCLWFSTVDNYNITLIHDSIKAKERIPAHFSTPERKLSQLNPAKDRSTAGSSLKGGQLFVQHVSPVEEPASYNFIAASDIREQQLYPVQNQNRKQYRFNTPKTVNADLHKLPVNINFPFENLNKKAESSYAEDICLQKPAAENSRKNRKRVLAFYATPSISYRTLNSSHRVSFGNITSADPENYVTHRPDIGLEAGVASIRPISKRIQIRSGLQFNYTRYSATASQGYPEVSTITFNTINRIQRISNLRTNSDVYKRNLLNETFQISLPVGIQYKILDRSGMNLTMGVSIQPTWVMRANSFLISTDYRNYVKVPDLLRPLNLFSGTELLFTRKKGKFQLQMGPQIRYQLLSNYAGKYPIREHLIDYGLRVGLIRTL